MSQKIPADLSKIEWLKSVRVALTGFIGALFLLILIKIWQGIDTPSYINWIFPLNASFCDAVFLAIVNIAFIVVLAIWTPVEQGTRENEAKLFYINWMKSVDRIDEFLKSEEDNAIIKDKLKQILEDNNKRDNPSPEKPPEVDSSLTATHVYDSSDDYTASDYFESVVVSDYPATDHLFR